METNLPAFTKRESQVIQMLVEGKSTKLISSQLEVSERAVEYHLTHIYEKLGVCCRIEAMIKLINLYQK